MGHEVFISHSAIDKAIADAITDTLEQQDIGCWVAPRNIRPGDTWGSSIVKAIEASKIMVVVYSAHANQSQQVIREVERAVQKNVVLLPFRIENIQPSEDMEYFLSTTHWLDATSPQMEQHLQLLLNTTRSILNRVEPELDSQPEQDLESASQLELAEELDSVVKQKAEKPATPATPPGDSGQDLIIEPKRERANAAEQDSGNRQPWMIAAAIILAAILAGTWFALKEPAPTPDELATAEQVSEKIDLPPAADKAENAAAEAAAASTPESGAARSSVTDTEPQTELINATAAVPESGDTAPASSTTDPSPVIADDQATVQQDAVIPAQTVPAGTVSTESAPVEKAPAETMPVETMPVETMPVEAVAVESAPEQTKEEPATETPVVQAAATQSSDAGAAAIVETDTPAPADTAQPAEEQQAQANTFDALMQQAESGDILAQYELGNLYQSGTEVDQNLEEAAKWYLLSASQGDARAQSKLGAMYSDGEGVPQDYTEAVNWYRLAAEQGSAQAQNSLGIMHEIGIGVPQNSSEAVKWYGLAAEQGHTSAQKYLSILLDKLNAQTNAAVETGTAPSQAEVVDSAATDSNMIATTAGASTANGVAASEVPAPDDETVETPILKEDVNQGQAEQPVE